MLPAHMPSVCFEVACPEAGLIPAAKKIRLKASSVGPG